MRFLRDNWFPCIAAAVLVAVFIFSTFARGATPVPERCYQFQKYLTQQVHTVFGIDAPVSVFAAQIQQESGCHPDAGSPVGARGLTQFMPDTARDLAALYPTELGPADPLNWKWAIGAQVRYMHDLVPRPWRTQCDWYAAKLAAYNGGVGWLGRDVLQCGRSLSQFSCSPCVVNRWFNNVELTPDMHRSRAARAENRGYPRRILLDLTPSYEAAGYGPALRCEGSP